ncbi:MAG: isoprenylcysteine carboxylmethyltransferase family protein [Desulfovibrionaceae bacterium]
MAQSERTSPLHQRQETSHDSPEIRIMPPLILYACLGAGVVAELLFPTSLPWLKPFWRVALGSAFGLAAFLFMMSGHSLFRRIGTNVRTNRPALLLVTQGMYRYSRNPMYVGMCGFLAGLGVIFDNLWLLAGCAPLALYFVLYVVPREERYMLRTFGAAYEQYKSEVRRWL